MEGESLGEAFFLEMLHAEHPTESHARVASVPRFQALDAPHPRRPPGHLASGGHPENRRLPTENCGEPYFGCRVKR